MIDRNPADPPLPTVTGHCDIRPHRQSHAGEVT
jgi:hypothetical protein